MRKSILLAGIITVILSGCMQADNTYVPLDIKTKNDKKLRVGISPDYPPLAFKEGNKLRGAEVDMAKTLAYYLDVEIVFVELPWKELVPALTSQNLITHLTNKEIDVIMSGMSITPEREKQVNFTQPYLEIGQMALIRKNEKKKFPDPQALLHTRLKTGFLRNTTSAGYVNRNFKHARLMPMKSVNQAVAALRNSDIDIFIHDAPTIWMIAGNSTEEQLTGLYWPLTREQLAWAVRPSDITLLNKLNKAIDLWKSNNVLKNTLNKWMKMRIEIQP